MPPRKKLIEVALPLEAINEASAREKSIRHGHPSTMHLWWARRPLAACRAVIFSSLVDDPDDPEAPKSYVDACKKLPAQRNALMNDTPRMRLFDFIETLVRWESTVDEKVLETARKLILLSTNGNPPPFLDPFGGGGSIPLEAQRLGLEAHASDLNPVAVMINKAQIEIPPRFANQPPVNPSNRAKFGNDIGWKGSVGLAADLHYYGEMIRDKAWERIGESYPQLNGETVVAWVWARTVKSPNPTLNVHVPLARSFELSKKKGRQAWIEPQIDPATKSVSFKVYTGQGKAPQGTMGRGGARCLVSNVPISWDYISSEGQEGRIGTQMMAIVTEGNGQRNFYSPSVEQEKAARVAVTDDAPTTLLPDQALGFRVQRYGLKNHSDLFSPRQLLALSTFSNLVNEVRDQIYLDAVAAGLGDDSIPLRNGGNGALAYSEAVSVYLAFAVSRCVDYWSTLAMMADGFIAHMFSRNALPMVWDYAEGNPFSDSTGNWMGAIEWVVRAVERLNPNRDGFGLTPIRRTHKMSGTDKLLKSTRAEIA